MCDTVKDVNGVVLSPFFKYLLMNKRNSVLLFSNHLGQKLVPTE